MSSPRLLSCRPLVLAVPSSAVDAMVAAAFAQGVTNPLGVGIGGDAIILGYHAQRNEVFIVDGTVAIPSGATPDVFLSEALTGRAETVGRHLVKGDINQYGYK